MIRYLVATTLFIFSQTSAWAAYDFPYGPIEIRVTSNDGTPVPGAQVSLSTSHEAFRWTWCGERPPYPCRNWASTMLGVRQGIAGDNGTIVFPKADLSSAKDKTRNPNVRVNYVGIKFPECQNPVSLRLDDQPSEPAFPRLLEPTNCRMTFDSSHPTPADGAVISCVFPVSSAELSRRMEKARTDCIKKETIEARCAHSLRF